MWVKMMIKGRIKRKGHRFSGKEEELVPEARIVFF
jgi:hypothetical protein